MYRDHQENNQIMKIIITITVILLAGSMLTGCDQSTASVPFTPPGPDPVTVLEEQIEAERQLREEAQAKAEKAEARVEEAATGKGNWQLAALGLSVLAVLGFFGGTAIGSRGRYHASS